MMLSRLHLKHQVLNSSLIILDLPETKKGQECTEIVEEIEEDQHNSYTQQSVFIYLIYRFNRC